MCEHMLSHVDNNLTQILPFSDISDSEIESYILNDSEVEMKTRIWMATNGSFLEVGCIFILQIVSELTSLFFYSIGSAGQKIVSSC